MKFLVLTLCLLVFGCQKDEKQFSEKMQVKILDDVKRDDIMGRIHLLFRSMDSRDWDSVKGLLADDIEINQGSGASLKKASDVIAEWKKTTQGMDALQHLVGNYGIEVDGRSAKLQFLGITTYFKKTKSGRNTKSLHGSYEIHMVQPEGDETNWEWKITKFQFIKNFTDGNLDL